MLGQRAKGRGNVAKSAGKMAVRPACEKRRFGVESHTSASGKQTRPAIWRVHSQQVHRGWFPLQEGLRCAHTMSRQPKGSCKIISAACHQDPRKGSALNRAVRKSLEHPGC